MAIWSYEEMPVVVRILVHDHEAFRTPENDQIFFIPVFFRRLAEKAFRILLANFFDVSHPPRRPKYLHAAINRELTII